MIVILLNTSVCFGGPKVTTYSNRNGSVQFRAVESRGSIRTYDNRGCFSGEYNRSGNSVRQTQQGFSQSRPNSSFSSQRRK